MGLLRVVLFLLSTLLVPCLLAAEDVPSQTPAAVATVDINTADVATIAEVLDGVGEKKAQAIVDYRNAHGPFHSAEEITEVKGIGPVILEHNRDRIVINP